MGRFRGGLPPSLERVFLFDISGELTLFNRFILLFSFTSLNNFKLREKLNRRRNLPRILGYEAPLMGQTYSGQIEPALFLAFASLSKL